MSTAKQYLDGEGLAKVWGKIKNLIDTKIGAFYEKITVQSNGNHAHDINVTVNTTPNLTASYNNGVLTISGATTQVVINGSTGTAGSHAHSLHNDDLG